MEVYFMLLLFLSALLLLLSSSAAVDTISANQAIKDGNTIVSDGEMFELGFFSPGNSKKRYLGIWYKKISAGTVVWVANRERPITDASGVFKVNTEGNLMILEGENTMIWSSGSPISVGGNLNPVVQLLDTGNLVVWDKSSTKQSLIWQSFDYIGDTFLAGMKFGKDLVTGRDAYLTSWTSPDDPSPGLFSGYVDTNGYPQLFVRQGTDHLQLRFGPWNGVGFSGFPTDVPNSIYSMDFVVNQKEVYHSYQLKSSVIQRIVLTWDGKSLILHWVDRIQEWVVYSDIGADSRGRFALCGPYGSCSMDKHPPCSCMEGFEPKVEEEWKASDWSSGCQRKKVMDCGRGDGFQKIRGVKLPDTRGSWYNESMSLGECEMACRRNCSCTAHANLDIKNGGSGCLLWFDELMDTKESDVGQDIYIRMAMAASDSETKTELPGNTVSQSSFNRKKGVLTAALSSFSVVVLLSAIAYVYRKKKKCRHMRARGNHNRCPLDKKNTCVQIENLDELPSFHLQEIVKATDNFSAKNKIGEGGFGPVYKGVLEDGREVAVKRLSEASKQGLDEFMNEVICIAKLQHRNLVKLLGYCMHGNEMILIYEYMANKSLDSFLFDETRSSMLDWPQRFRIIHGMARGILYLHQDSCLQIIHRDIKAGNILLDDDMNPKISDFGLARKFVGLDDAAKTKKVVGTLGYISPEYALHGRFSTKSDVFSFGVLVLEIVSGEKNTEFCYKDHTDNLLGHAWRLYQEDRSIELMSASLRHSCIVSEVLRSIHIGLLCVQNHAEDRPTMLSVVLMLVSESALPQPKQPAFFRGESHCEGVPLSSVHEDITLLCPR